MSERVMNSVLNGKDVEAFTWSEYDNRLPRQYKATIPGTLNGKPIEFSKTNGKGQGTHNVHYAYFIMDGVMWCVPTGLSWPARIELKTSEYTKPVGTVYIYDYIRDFAEKESHHA